MSKISYALITVMITALLFMGAVRGYQLYARKAAQWQAQQEANVDAFSFQQQVPLQLAAPQPEPVSRPVLFTPPTKQEVFLEDEPLSPQAQTEQAQQTIVSILADYKDDKNLRAFNRDLQEATQGAAKDLGSLSGGDLTQVMRENPQIAAVVSRHMQNPDFAKTVQQILSNPQFIQSVQDLQRAQAPVQAAAGANAKKTAK